MRGLAMIAGALLLAAIPPEAPALAAHAKPPSMLSAAELDPARVLPPPPVAGSAQAAAELVELKSIEARRTPGEEAAARLDGDTKNAGIFTEVLGPRFDLAALPATARLMAIVRSTETAAADRGKAEFRRPRPYMIDPSLKSCKRNDDPLSSYPSGHTTMAFSMGEVLARLVPSQGPGLLARAQRYGESRIICGQHFRSDVTTGEALGVLVAERLLAKPDFRVAFDEARGELARAGIAR